MPDYTSKIVEHANSSPSREICGVLIGIADNKLQYIPCTNTSSTDDTFILDAIEYAKIERTNTIKAIVHSHINDSEQPSMQDIINCNRGNLPWIIYSTVTDKFSTYYPNTKSIPLLGRPYVFGVTDCWGLVCDYHLEKYGISIGRPDGVNQDWYKDGFNAFELYANDFGFNKVDDISNDTVLLFKFNNSKVPNHCAIYNNGSIIHHSTNRLSNKEVFGGYWQANYHAAYKHERVK